MINILVVGEPVAQGRPKFSARNGFIKAYDPAKSRDYKDYVRLAAAEQMQGKELLQGALKLSICIYRTAPQAIAGKPKKAEEAERGDIRPTTKPDLDNYVKGVKDALKGVVWGDDSQIVDYIQPFGKFYSAKPRIEIMVKTITEI